MRTLKEERELISAELLNTRDHDSTRYVELYAAQQALSWVSEPEGFRSPFNMIMEVPTNEPTVSIEPLSA